MSDHTEWGHAGDALYTLHPRAGRRGTPRR
jgi:hypothetical protein